MYKMLIVDDEPIIVDGLFELFSENSDKLELELYKAYSGEAARCILAGDTIDLLLTDIHMPKTTGLDLLKMAATLWPRCKVIMLTGYNEFEYAKEAIRHGAFHYVLKTEGDNAIMATIDRALAELRREWSERQLLAQARESVLAARPLMQMQLMRELLDGKRYGRDALAERVRKLGLTLDPLKPLYVVFGRIDHWRQQQTEELSESDRALFCYAVRNIAEEYLAGRAEFAAVPVNETQWVWLVQSKKPQDAPTNWGSRTLRRLLEGVQQQSHQLLGVSTSFILTGSVIDWEAISGHYLLLKWQLCFGMGKRSEMIMYEKSGEADAEAMSRVYYAHHIQHLSMFLENGQRDAFMKEFGELSDEAATLAENRPWLLGELFISIAGAFVSCMNRSGLTEQVGRHIDLGKLFNFHAFSSWPQIADYFGEVASWYFTLNADKAVHPNEEVVQRVMQYIHCHLSEELSLSQLGEIVYLNPFYLSRIFKKLVGIPLGEYVIEARISKAKQLLATTNRKVHDIAREVGFVSSSYFTRFFKRVTTLTPVEFREKTDRFGDGQDE